MNNRYEIVGDVTILYLKKNDGSEIKTLIDTEDLGRLIDHNYTWSVYTHKTDSLYCAGPAVYYYLGMKKTKRIGLHRWIMNDPEGLVVDHINNDTLDNRKMNLRVVTIQQNSQNRAGVSSNNTSGYRGVRYDKRSKKWISAVK